MKMFYCLQQLKNVCTALNISRNYCASSRIKAKQENDKDIDKEIIVKLKKLSLLDLKDDQSVSVLKAAINFTECIRTAKIDETIEPMYAPFEEKLIPLRDDKVQHNIKRETILKNAALLEEEYFVAPLNKHGFVYGPQGRMLLRNLEEHWFLHCITMSPYNIFLSEQFSDTLNFVTKSPMGKIPFGLAAIKDTKNSWNENIQPITSKMGHHKSAEIAIFSNNTETKSLYHKIQKERKVWWRKLAQQPSRFKIMETRRSKDLDSIDIEAQFPFGNITVEKITYHTDIQKILMQIDNKKDLVDIQMVEHVVSLNWGCLALLCDAYNIDETAKMHIHSKLAPHKVAIHIKKSENETNTGSDDLNRFVLYLNNMLRTKGLNTILTISEEVVNACLVPFIVLVDRTSLENGIIYVTNRSTTLNQAIHITDLAKYITMHC